MATGKFNRSIDLKLRQAEFTNLNFSPEKSGPDLVERADLSLKFVVKDMEIDELVSAKGNPLQLLWHADKTVMFRDIKSFAVDLEAEGTLTIGVSDEQVLTFENAKLKKVTITPHVELQAEVKCQVRVDPTGNLEELGQIRIQQNCVVAFSGKGIDKSKSGQQKLEV